MQTGLARVANTAQGFGLPRPRPYPALALGTTEATPLQIAAAYATFANGGHRIQPNVIAAVPDDRVTNLSDDKTSIAHSPGDKSGAGQIIQPSTAYMITDMLTDVMDHGTARAARGLIKDTAIAGKTGTSRDGWFVGYTPNLICAIWIGFDDNQQLGLTGAAAALPVWMEFMKGAVEMRPELGGKAFARPEEIRIVDIDPETGLIASAACPQRERIAITSALMPSAECYRHHGYSGFNQLPDRTIQSAETEALIARHTKPGKSRLSATVGSAQFQTGRTTTRVDSNARSRPTLVNDMRLN